jgi:hypothetical protein
LYRWNGKLLVDGQRIGGLHMEEFSVEIEGIGEAVGGVDAHDQGSISQLRQLDSGCGGQAGFAHPTFAAEKQDPHASHSRTRPVRMFAGHDLNHIRQIEDILKPQN